MTIPTVPATKGDETRSRHPTVLVRYPWLVAGIGLLFVAATVAIQAAGIVQASNGNWERGTLFAWTAISAAVVAFSVGLLAVIRTRARRLGLLVMVLALLTNPYLLVQLFALVG